MRFIVLRQSVKWSGPAVAAIGYHFGLPSLLWIGAFLAVINALLENVARGGGRGLGGPAISAVIGAMVLQPWSTGAALGLLTYTALQAAAELFMLIRSVVLAIVLAYF